MYLNPHRWIIIIHVAFILQLKANAQSGQPGSQPGQTPSKSTVFAVFITIIFFIGILSVYIRHCSRPNPQYSTGNYLRRRTNNHSRRGGLETAVVESFPVFPYSSVKLLKLGSNDLECSICLNEFEEEETVRLLPICNHLFHLDCIDAWLYSHATCPVCRSDLTATIKSEYSRNDPHVVIDVDDEERFEKFPRSNSTGHSMGRFSDGFERFTLRLPEDVKRRIVAVNGRRLKRARSFDFDLTVEGSGSGGLLDRVNWVDRFGLFVAKSNFGSVR